MREATRFVGRHSGAVAAVVAAGVLVLVAGASTCSRATAAVRWERAFYDAEQLHIDGQHDAARQRFAALRASAHRGQDADEAGLMACEAARRGGETLAAAACYDALGQDATEREVRARALLHAAEIRVFELERQADGERLLWILVERATDTAAGQRALDHLYAMARDAPSRVDATVGRMLDLARAAPLSDLADNLLIRTAMLLEARGGTADLRTADEAMMAFERDHVGSPARVAALMVHARVLTRLDEPAREAVVLEKVVGDWEASAVFGSYYVPDHSAAALRLIALYRGRLADLERAESHLHHLVEMVEAQSGVFEVIAQLADVQEQRGNLRAARATWRRLVQLAEKRDTELRGFDARVCGEEARSEDRGRCSDATRTFAPLPVKEVARAQGEIARLGGLIAARRP